MFDNVGLQVKTVAEWTTLIGPTNVLILSILFILYQIYSPSALPDTKYQRTVHQFQNQIDGIEEKVMSKLNEFGEKQNSHIQITRAIASVENPSEEIDDAIVDDYLLQNGVDKDDFLLPRESTKDHVIDEDD